MYKLAKKMSKRRKLIDCRYGQEGVEDSKKGRYSREASPCVDEIDIRRKVKIWLPDK